LLDEQHRMLGGKARKELLRPLPNKIPAQMAENDNAVRVIPASDSRNGRGWRGLQFNSVQYFSPEQIGSRSPDPN
ncbi:MAG TPA: hypothetical protein VK934_09765, partial [Fimbriimonas sp.]|nr:hypothetical protein [Fimbriimonas sp.]